MEMPLNLSMALTAPLRLSEKANESILYPLFTTECSIIGQISLQAIEKSTFLASQAVKESSHGNRPRYDP